MTVAAATDSSARRLNWRVRALVALALAGYVTVTLVASLQKGLSFDEGEQIAIGYNIWTRHGFRMEAANGDFVKRWATLPLLVSRPNYVSDDDPSWRAGLPYKVAYAFFYQLGNDPAWLRLQCRAMMALLGAATGLLVFFCSRDLFGNAGGLVSLAMFVLSPGMLSFGGIVSTEMSVCLSLLGATWCIWRLLHRVTWRRLAGGVVFVALLVLSKLTALLLFPITAMLIAVKLVRGEPLEWGLGRRGVIRSRLGQFGVFSGLLLVHAAASWGAIWAHYDFRYAASPHRSLPVQALLEGERDPIDPTAARFLAWSRRTHFLPEAFVSGTELLLGQNDSRLSFMNGQWKRGGRRTFFPYAMWAKTPPAVIVLAGLAAAAWWMLVRRRHRAPPNAGTGIPDASAALTGAIPFVVLIVVYLAVAIGQNLNIGFRHVLPVYPALYVLSGAVVWWWSAAFRWMQFVVLGLLACIGVDSALIFPHYLAYFSPLVGGPSQGYRHLVDSSLDWGMDLPGLERWLAVNNPGDRAPVFFAYFGTGDPDRYKIKSNRLPGNPEWREVKVYPLTPGIYVISATLLEGVGTWTEGPWNKIYERAYRNAVANFRRFEATADDPAARQAMVASRPPGFWAREYSFLEKLRFGRLTAWLRHQRPPDDEVGYSILIWRLSLHDLDEALFGPPIEFEDAPLQVEN